MERRSGQRDSSAGVDPARDGVSVLLRRAAGLDPERVALIAPGPAGEVRLTYRELDRRVDEVAAGLGALGLEPGDRVALVLPGGATYVEALLGALRAGLVVVSLNPGYTSPELAAALGEAGVELVVWALDVGHVVESAVEVALAGTRRALLTDGAPWDAMCASGRAALQAGTAPGGRERGGEDLALLLPTSGVSGRPRAAMLSHRALLANVAQCAALDPPPVGPGDVVLLVLPLFHVYGLGALLGTLRQAGTAVLLERFAPDAALDVVARTAVTTVPATPGMWAAWAGRPGFAEAFAGVRTMLSGAAPLPREVQGRVRELTGRRVLEGYGLTEAAPVVTTVLPGDADSDRFVPGSVGRPVPGVGLRIVDATGEPAEEGDPGEVLVRGDNLFSGYWPDGHGGPDAEGWFATGDLGYLDPTGALHVVDRRKELVLVDGFNVYPREVEDVLVEHPSVAEAAVVAVPDEASGEAVKAYVVPAAGASASAAELVEQLAEHCAGRLARFKRPAQVEVVEELPRTATGKVVKHLLAAPPGEAERAEGADEGADEGSR